MDNVVTVFVLPAAELFVDIVQHKILDKFPAEEFFVVANQDTRQGAIDLHIRVLIVESMLGIHVCNELPEHRTHSVLCVDRHVRPISLLQHRVCQFVVCVVWRYTLEIG